MVFKKFTLRPERFSKTFQVFLDNPFLGNFVLVGLKGQFSLDKTQVKAKGKLVQTKDGQSVVIILKSNKVFLR